MSKGTKTIIICFVLLYGAMGAIAQKPQQRDAAEILLGLQKLNFLGSVLYVAAHPDDENTRIISYFSNKVLANTAYLSMTRGDGGQNLIGSEIREYLGIIRTQELLAARRTDGGRQFFTRANDFGYSKSADETQEIWDREQVLSDVVWTFRNFRPDVVITRFPTDGRGGHGHHTTSALLAAEAFNLAGDKKAFSDQLSLTQPWSPKRLYLNTGRWWNQSVNADTDGVITLDVGEYSPLLGQSYSEIAAISRSQHKSQGFGSTGTRGEQLEFLEYRRGDRANKDIFEGINTTWTRVEGGKKIQGMIEEAIGSFIPSNPGLSVSKLLEIRKAIQTIKDPYWKSQKTRETDRLIADCLGLYLEVSSSDYSAAPGEQINLSFEAVNRSGIAVVLNKIGNKMGLMDSVMNTSLPQKNKITFNNSILLPSDMTIGQPYWLQKEGTLGMYSVEDRRHIGKPENDPAITVDFTVEIAGEKIVFTR
ncbi:MAG: PIG-L family deacetylase, partial [Cyclobacteriaceae bacterium]|nr:PIG-L family deacetylase [Cyclobacteriaceae bacterium]